MHCNARHACIPCKQACLREFAPRLRSALAKSAEICQAVARGMRSLEPVFNFTHTLWKSALDNGAGGNIWHPPGSSTAGTKMTPTSRWPTPCRHRPNDRATNQPTSQTGNRTHPTAGHRNATEHAPFERRAARSGARQTPGRRPPPPRPSWAARCACGVPPVWLYFLAFAGTPQICHSLQL